MGKAKSTFLKLFNKSSRDFLQLRRIDGIQSLELLDLLKDGLGTGRQRTFSRISQFQCT
jgi:hypothetical protein